MQNFLSTLENLQAHKIKDRNAKSGRKNMPMKKNGSTDTREKRLFLKGVKT